MFPSVEKMYGERHTKSGNEDIFSRVEFNCCFNTQTCVFACLVRHILCHSMNLKLRIERCNISAAFYLLLLSDILFRGKLYEIITKCFIKWRNSFHTDRNCFMWPDITCTNRHCYLRVLLMLPVCRTVRVWLLCSFNGFQLKYIIVLNLLQLSYTNLNFDFIILNNGLWHCQLYIEVK